MSRRLIAAALGLCEAGDWAGMRQLREWQRRPHWGSRCERMLGDRDRAAHSAGRGARRHLAPCRRAPQRRNRRRGLGVQALRLIAHGVVRRRSRRSTRHLRAVQESARRSPPPQRGHPWSHPRPDHRPRTSNRRARALANSRIRRPSAPVQSRSDRQPARNRGSCAEGRPGCGPLLYGWEPGRSGSLVSFLAL